MSDDLDSLLMFIPWGRPGVHRSSVLRRAPRPVCASERRPIHPTSRTARPGKRLYAPPVPRTVRPPGPPPVETVRRMRADTAIRFSYYLSSAAEDIETAMSSHKRKVQFRF